MPTEIPFQIEGCKAVIKHELTEVALAMYSSHALNHERAVKRDELQAMTAQGYPGMPQKRLGTYSSQNGTYSRNARPCMSQLPRPNSSSAVMTM
ncbi:Hypothetical protein FKW44_002131 [Caligus rogercresseyi]|uniref:Uncharacterized protein n=1 Tax=Caligus rogercresseyi TaxID=217165 RepID=A0A7T8QW22_CALRO|nr:Hypothetical protein FKW44_002131 [Caligus rogercresseyi]